MNGTNEGEKRGIIGGSDYDDRNPRPLSAEEVRREKEELGLAEPPFHVKVAGFQKDVGAWSARNFGWTGDPARTAVDPLFGAAEEIGELALAHAAGPNGRKISDADWRLLCLIGRMGDLVRAHLKGKQGIRGSGEELGARALAAMHEVRGALVEYAAEQGIDREGPRAPLIRRGVGLAPITAGAALAEGGDAVADVVVYLADYAARNGIDMEGAVNHTWARPVDPETKKGGVRYRDWTVNRQDGGGHGKVIVAEGAQPA